LSQPYSGQSNTGGTLSYTGQSGAGFTGTIVFRTLAVGSNTNFGGGYLAIASTNSAWTGFNTILYNDPTSASINTPITIFCNSGTTSISNTLSFALNQGTLNWAGSINENPNCNTIAGSSTYQVNLRKTGTGTLVLSGVNNFGGMGTSGNWVLGNIMPTAGLLDLANQYAAENAVLSVGNGGTVEFDSSVASHTFTVGGLSGVSQVTLQDTAGNPILLQSGYNNTSSTVSEFAGVLQGPGSFGLLGGTQILYSPNTYLGTTTISGGTLQLVDPHAVPATSTVEMSGGQVVFDKYVVGNAFNFGGLDGPGGTIPLQNNATPLAAVQLTVGGNNQNTTYGGLLTGLGAITKIGTGTWKLTGANNYAGQTVLNGGTLELALSAQSPILSRGGVNIQSGHAVFDYTSPGNDPASQINTLLAASYNGGAWNQGQFQSSTQTTYVGLGWVDGTATDQVAVQPALYGDANLDGSVNFGDLSKVLANYGQSGMTWSQGDFNYDGTVNFSDLSKVLANYGDTGGPTVIVAGGAVAGVSPVPEPSSIAMLASILAVAGLWVVRRRRVAAAIPCSHHAMYLPRGV
jgi:autotransporter-associated beta strand protein